MHAQLPSAFSLHLHLHLSSVLLLVKLFQRVLKSKLLLIRQYQKFEIPNLLSRRQIPDKLCLKFVLHGFCDIEDLFSVCWEHVTFNRAGLELDEG